MVCHVQSQQPLCLPSHFMGSRVVTSYRTSAASPNLKLITVPVWRNVRTVVSRCTDNSQPSATGSPTLTPVHISSYSRPQIFLSLGSNRSRRRRQDKEEEQVSEWQRSCELILTGGRVPTADCSTTLTFQASGAHHP